MKSSSPRFSSSEAGLLIVVCVAASRDPRQALLWRWRSSAWLWQVTTVVQSGILTAPKLHQTNLDLFLCFVLFFLWFSMVIALEFQHYTCQRSLVN